VSQVVEKEVAEYIQEKFQGFGPKQSRNFLQALGLTRYEIPIDSRVTDWLNNFGFPVRLSAAALADSNYYDFVSKGVQALCAASGVYPCVLDAAIFALKDRDAWTEANVIY
jgi:thermostable 8-oxoguanine DNA glycosylase